MKYVIDEAAQMAHTLSEAFLENLDDDERIARDIMFLLARFQHREDRFFHALERIHVRALKVFDDQREEKPEK